MSGLTPENTLNEFFEFFEHDNTGVRVVPLTVKEQSDDTRLAIIIRGEHQTASVIMATLLTRVEELLALQAQAEAESEASPIITP